MQCPKCGKEIPDNSKFCLECGSNISAISGQSGVEGDVSLGNLKSVVGLEGEEIASQGAIMSEPSDVSLGDMQSVGRVPSHGAHDGAGFGGEPLSNRYELGEEIGRGGFAVVYKATDKKLGRTVAIKKLHPEHDTQTLERFKREARVIAGLNHRNVVGVYDVGEDHDGIYLVMEYVEGGTLREYLKEKGRLELPEALKLMRGMAQGLSYAHRNNLVHRDIKPANILLQRDGDELVPKIVDFGLARAGSDSELSMTGYGMGTPYYMPPEQRRDAKSVNHTADIYALGKVLYEMVTGEIPDNVDPDVIPPPRKLSDVIFKCIKSKPEERYFSADELLQDLEGLGGIRHQARGNRETVGSANECPACGAENPTDVKFCEQCGGGLFRNCPECDRENSIHKQYCGGCGTDVEGFTTAQEIFARVKKFESEKKWSRVAKEYKLFDQETRLPGKQGAELRMGLEESNRTAEDKLRQREILRITIETAVRDETRYEEAIKLVAQYQEIDPHNAEFNALPNELKQKIDDRDFKNAEAHAAAAEQKEDFETAIVAYQQYLRKHLQGKHVKEAEQSAETELPAKIADRDYGKVQKQVQALKATAGNDQNWNDTITRCLNIIPLCGEFCDKHGDHKQADVLLQEQKEAEGQLKIAEDELAYSKEVPVAHRHIDRRQYEQAIGVYRRYLEKYSVHAAEAKKMVDETLPRLIAEREAEKLRLKRRKQKRMALFATAVLVAVAIGFVIDRVVLKKRIGDFKSAVEQKDSAQAGAIGKKIGKRFNIAPLMDALRQFENARNAYHKTVGNDAASLEKYGGDDWQGLQQHVAQANQPGDPVKGAGQYQQATDLVKGIKTRIASVLESRQSFEDAVAGIGDADLRKYAPKEWADVETAVASAEAETDPEKAAELWRFAADKGKLAATEFKRQKQLEEKMLDAKWNWESTTKDTKADVERYAADEWAEVQEIAEQAAVGEKTMRFTDAEQKYRQVAQQLAEATELSNARKKEAEYFQALEKAAEAVRAMEWDAAYAALDEAESGGHVDLSKAGEFKQKLDHRLKPMRDAKAAYLNKIDEIGRAKLERSGGKVWKTFAKAEFLLEAEKDPEKVAEGYRKLTASFAEKMMCRLRIQCNVAEALVFVVPPSGGYAVELGKVNEALSLAPFKQYILEIRGDVQTIPEQIAIETGEAGKDYGSRSLELTVIQCPLPKTGQTKSFAQGDDGTHQAGVDDPNPRFADNGDGTVTDHRTGLVWVKAPHEFSVPDGKTLFGKPKFKQAKEMKWADAVAFCDRLEFAGRSDWRLPNRKELMSLVDYGETDPALPAGHPFEGIPSSYYWTGSSYASSTGRAWFVGMYSGYVDYLSKSYDNRVWPVAGRR